MTKLVFICAGCGIEDPGNKNKYFYWYRPKECKRCYNAKVKIWRRKREMKNAEKSN